MPQLLRAFVAIPIPDATALFLGQIQERLRPSVREMRWVATSTIHLTLAFLGDIEPIRVPEVAARMDGAAEPLSPFLLQVKGAGVFPNRRNARVLWVGLDGALDRLRALHTSLACALGPLGFSLSDRQLRAHVTIGRARQHIDAHRLGALLDSLKAVASEVFRVDRLVLYQSLLKPGGPEHRPLHQTHLKT